MWSVHGKLIGVFGVDDWVLEDNSSYREKEHTYREKMRQPVLVQPNPPDCLKHSLNEASSANEDNMSKSDIGGTGGARKGRSLEEQAKWRIYRDKVRGIGSRALNSYVYSLRDKPSYGVLTEQNDEYQTVTVRYNTIIILINKFHHFLTLLFSWILTQRKHPISSVIAMEKSFQEQLPARERASAKKQVGTTFDVGNFAGKMLHVLRPSIHAGVKGPHHPAYNNISSSQHLPAVSSAMNK